MPLAPVVDLRGGGNIRVLLVVYHRGNRDKSLRIGGLPLIDVGMQTTKVVFMFSSDYVAINTTPSYGCRNNGNGPEYW
jgi:hypothetical protein